MVQSSSVSQAAIAAGVPARYLYWRGRSNRRYLFTRTAALADFAEGVAIAAVAGQIVWAGEIGQMPGVCGADWRSASFYVHLLAATADERRAIVEDLSPAARGCVRLAA
jgi:hypothetical protein